MENKFYRFCLLSLILFLICVISVNYVSADSKYKVIYVPQEIHWVQAKEAAEAAGGHLATITSKEENDKIFSLVKDLKYWIHIDDNSYGPWLGGYKEFDKWRWVTGENFLYTNWYPGEPNNYGNTENRLEFRAGPYTMSDMWNDAADYGVAKGYVIEWDDYSSINDGPSEMNNERFAQSPSLASVFSYAHITTAPMEVSFEDKSTGNPTTWLWDFGDGTTDATQNPTHYYKSEGTYDVSLTVSDGDTIAIPVKNQVTIINSDSISSEPKTNRLNSNSLPDLTITCSSIYYNPDLSSISVNLTIENRGGTNPGKFFITYFLTETKTNHPLMSTDARESILGRDDVNGLEPGETREKSTTKTLPIDKMLIKSGEYWFGIVIDSRNEIDESDEENNTLYGPEPINL